MSLSKRDNRLSGARDIALNTRVSGLVGKRDKIDFYQLDLSQTSDFSLSFNRLKGRASAQVKLLNSSGGVVSNFKLGNRPVNIQNTLEAGTYYIRVAARGKSNRIRYRFLTAAAIAEPGETAATSRNIGVLNGTYTNQDLVGVDDRLDYYKFSLDQISSFTASLGQLSHNVYMNLFYDSNGDGLFEESEIANATGTSTNDAFISDTLPKGNYLIEIRSSTYPTNTRYQLTLSSIPTPGNLPVDPGNSTSTPYDLGVLTNPITAIDLVGADDRQDYYKFNLNQERNVTLRLGQLSHNVYMRLFYDSDGNELFEESEIANVTGTSTNDAFISDTLPKGNYLIEIRSSTYPKNTRYELVISPT